MKMEPHHKLIAHQPELTRNLSAGDISALEWIDCNGSSDEDEIIDVSHLHAYSHSDSQDHVRSIDRERGDGDSGEEVSPEHDMPLTKNFNCKVEEVMMSENQAELVTITENSSLTESAKTYTISAHNSPDELITIMSGISSLELDDDEFDNLTNANKECAHVVIDNERNSNIEKLSNSSLSATTSCDDKTMLRCLTAEDQMSMLRNVLVQALVRITARPQDMNDILKDLQTMDNTGLVGAIVSSSADSSLSPVAPIAEADDDAELSSLEMEESILEAPVQFRGQQSAFRTIADERESLEYIDNGDIDLMNNKYDDYDDVRGGSVAANRDHNNAAVPEAGSVAAAAAAAVGGDGQGGCAAPDNHIAPPTTTQVNLKNESLGEWESGSCVANVLNAAQSDRVRTTGDCVVSTASVNITNQQPVAAAAIIIQCTRQCPAVEKEEEEGEAGSEDNDQIERPTNASVQHNLSPTTQQQQQQQQQNVNICGECGFTGSGTDGDFEHIKRSLERLTEGGMDNNAKTENRVRMTPDADADTADNSGVSDDVSAAMCGPQDGPVTECDRLARTDRLKASLGVICKDEELISGKEVVIGRRATNASGIVVALDADECASGKSIYGKSRNDHQTPESERAAVVETGSAVTVQTSIHVAVPAPNAQAHIPETTASAAAPATSRPHARREAGNTTCRSDSPAPPECAQGGSKAQLINNSEPQHSTSRSPSVSPPPSDNSKVKYIWEFANGRLVFKKLDDVLLLPEVQKCRDETESDSAGSRLSSEGGPLAEESGLTANSLHVETHTLFDVIERYADRIESEIAKCSNESNKLINRESSEAADVLLSSRTLNKGVFEGRLRLKRLESKLREAAGLVANDPNPCAPTPTEPTAELLVEADYANPKDAETASTFFSGYCEFDVNKVADFGGYSDSDFYVVYDELDDDVETEGCEEMLSSSSSCEDEHYHLISCRDLTEVAMRGEAAMGSEVGGGEHRKRHNPDHDNLKSLLKKPSRSRGTDGKKNRVVFNEKRNEFFDADYIILIREECEYDEEDDDGVCTCNQHEMVRLTCCEPNCNCNYEGVGGGVGGYEQTPPSPKFAPPLEFVDAVTLSPPEGYKDMDLGELAALQLLTRQRAAQLQGAVCRDCSSAQHPQHLSDDSESPHSDNEEEESGGHVENFSFVQPHHPPERPTGEISKTDQSQQTTPTTPTTPLPEDTPQRFILETMTMTTVTEQRILREADGGEDRNTTSGNGGGIEDQCASETNSPSLPPLLQARSGGSPISGILKGGRLWKQQQQQQQQHHAPQPSTDISKATIMTERPQVIETTFSADSEETSNRRSVRFCESDDETRNSCDGESEHQHINDEETVNQAQQTDESGLDNQKDQETDSCNNAISPDGTEMLLTFKLGNHLLMSNNSLRPNSAVRQLFPCTNTLVSSCKEDVESGQQYIVTSESLRAFEEAKRSKLPQLNCDSPDDSSIRRTIERNTLRRSLIRYEPRSKKIPPKTDNSLVERIKQLTCDVDDHPLPESEQNPGEEDIPVRTSPPGEEARKSPEVNSLNNKNIDKNSFSPSSSSTTSSNSSMSSTYKKITDLFAKKQDKTHAQAETQTMTDVNNRHNIQTAAPDLGNGGLKAQNPDFIEPQCAVSKYNVTHEARKQFLSTLAPLTACVSGAGVHEEYYYQLSSHGGERASVASTIGTEYSLEDIDAVLQTETSEEPKRVAPDVLVGTPSASESGDELAMFVQQDAGRIERIKKRYQSENNTNEEDDEHDDYGFNRRPSVRGIKPRFGSTNEIIQQMQSQIQPPSQPAQTTVLPTQQRPASQMSWPYYSETSLSTIDNKNSRTSQTMNSRLNKEDSGSEYSLQNQSVTQDPKYSTYSQPYQYAQDSRTYRVPSYRPSSLIEENIYQNCTNQRCTQQHYTLNSHTTPVMRIGGGCSDLYQTIPTRRTGRPESPPPMEIARNYHQTMVLIPYNHIEGYHASLSPNPHYTADPGNYARVAGKGKPPQPSHIIRQSQDSSINYQCNTNSLLKVGQKQMIRVPYSSGQPLQVHLMASRSESPQLPGQFATARATQTPAAVMSTANYYQPPPAARYRPAIGPTNNAIWHNQDPYATKIVRNSSTYATTVRPPVNDSTVDQPVNGFRVPEGHYSTPRESAPTSPTKSRFSSERGVPEGAASISPQDSYQGPPNSSSAVSPTTPQTPAQANVKPMYYAMNV